MFAIIQLKNIFPNLLDVAIECICFTRPYKCDYTRHLVVLTYYINVKIYHSIQCIVILYHYHNLGTKQFTSVNVWLPS